MHLKRIVITGGPGTGKTTIINTLEEKGYCCFHEVIRDMTAEAKKTTPHKKQVSNPLAFVEDPMHFNMLLLKEREAHYDASFSVGANQCFFDRGMPDVLAYMDYFKQAYPPSFEARCKEKQYDFVFVAPPWEDIYVSDNERLECFDEAVVLHEHLMNTYTKLEYVPILIPKTTITKRTEFILERLNS